MLVLTITNAGSMCGFIYYDIYELLSV